jgi:hypothetical protein
MSFLTYEPDLSGTIYEEDQQHLQAIRDNLVAEINKANPTWLDNPKGIFRQHWDTDSVSSTCYLIWIASMQKFISDRICPESAIRLQDKFKKLLNTIDEKQYLENLAELEIAWAFAARVSPLIVEPLASVVGGADPSNETESPDFAFDISGERVYLEVTFFYVGVLEKWQKTVNAITTTLHHRLTKRERHLKLHVQLPLQPFDSKQHPFDANQVIEQIWRKMCSTDFSAGKQTVIANGMIRWEPYLVAQGDAPLIPPAGSTTGIYPPLDKGWDVLIRVKALKENPSGSVSITPFGVFHSPDFVVDKASFTMEPDIVVLSEKDVQAANEMVLKAFKNKLQHKRVQFPLRRESPYFLVIKPGSYRLLGNGLFDMIEQHIWKKYNWITGIILHTSRYGFLPASQKGEFNSSINPEAVCQASDSLKAMFEGKEQFHAVRESAENI